MEALSPAPARPGTRDRGYSESFAARPRVFNDRDSLRHGSSPIGRENRSPSNVPKGLETMLKTTTETGDIGMFSIKPSRLPQPLNTPRRMGTGFNELGIQKTRSTFQPYGVPVVDDRRRLPSYARDNSSDVFSVYETASQKSASHTFEDPDYRSYSMTQTSYSSYTLSNHRSYASLRSQHDVNSLAQRPRSPFAYPTRLRRPGFRPSSPALTDGGAVDYSRRVEIDRGPYGFGQSTASPSSLYAQKRKPPMSLRHEANRSTPSLLSQPSPPRRSFSPLVPRHNGCSGNDWQRRNATASGNTSPARSTLSLASTVNLYTAAPISSTTTTPGKLHPPSPLYYDYTEDFETEVCNQSHQAHQSQVMGPPPQFRIERTIPEDRPISSDGPSVKRSRDGLTSVDNGSWPSRHGASDQPGERNDKLSVDGTNLPTKERLPSSHKEEGIQRDAGNELDPSEHKKIVRLSGLGYGAQELNCHVEEAFGLPSSKSFVIDVSKDSGGDAEKEPVLLQSGGQFGSEKEPLSTRTSSYSIGSQFPQFPLPPGIQGGDDFRVGEHQTESTSHVVNRNSRRSVDMTQEPDEKNSLRRTSRESQCLPPSGRARARSSGLNSLDGGLSELAQLIDSTNKPRERLQNLSVTSHKIPTILPAFPDKFSQNLPQRADPRSSLLSSLSQQRGKDLQMWVERQPARRSNDRVRRADPSTHDTKDVPNFSHQIPHKVVARSESPMLAPKPISPARQLKLKNSIPQIMKALPPVPPEPPQVDAIPVYEYSIGHDLTNLFLPISTARGPSPLQVIENDDTATQLTPRVSALPEDHGGLSKSGASTDQPNDKITEEETKNFIPKLKLKGKGSTAFQDVPPSKPWSQKEDLSLSDRDTSIQPPSTFPSKNASVLKPPKFKLRIIRASNSTLGTVRVTRDGESTDSQGGAYPSNPKDLFTPSPGIDNFFRLFGRHLHSHSRKTSANSNFLGEETEPIFGRTSTSSPQGSSPGGNESHLDDLPSGRMAGLEARSVFSDDSSQAQVHHSLRKRISNLRARIAVPYAAKSGAQSYDDITWKDRNGVPVLLPPANLSDSNLHENRRSSEIKPMRRLVEKLHRQRLKAKVRSWIKGARSVIARVRPGHSRAGSRSGNKA